MDYNSLVLQIQAYTNRNEPTFVAAIPNIINQAMSRIYSEAKSIGFQKTITNDMVAGNPTILRPIDYKETINFKYTVPGATPFQSFLFGRTYEFCVAYWPNPNLTAAPQFYSADLDVPAVQDGPSSIFLSPTPDQNYQYTLTYLSFPPNFDGLSPTNFLTDRYPNLLLYACLVEAVPYLKSDERIPVFESLYNRALQGINQDTKERYTDRLTDRNKD